MLEEAAGLFVQQLLRGRYSLMLIAACGCRSLLCSDFCRGVELGLQNLVQNHNLSFPTSAWRYFIAPLRFDCSGAFVDPCSSRACQLEISVKGVFHIWT